MENGMPIEEALMAFVGIDIAKEEMEKGIPFVSFVIKKGEGADFRKPLPLPAADEWLEGQEAAGNEILYRVDYLRGGSEKFAAGILFAGEKPENFLKLLGSSISSGSTKAGSREVHSYLEAHLTLCRLEGLAREEISFMEKEEAGDEGYREANRSYYRDVLSYVESGRRHLNTGAFGISLPPFPQRSVFMAGWYREHKGSR